MVDGFDVFLRRQQYYVTWFITTIINTTSGDIFLMQCFLLSNPTEKELRCLMDCREYLQVTTLADITSVDGKDTMLQVWQGRFYKRKIFSYSSPRQPPRTHLDWDMWRQILTPVIQNIFNRTLKFPLDRREKEALLLAVHLFIQLRSLLSFKIKHKNWRNHLQVIYIQLN